MNRAEIFSFDPKTQEILERLSVPFAICQYIDKQVATIALSQGFCDEFDFESLEDAYRAMDGDMRRAAHPDDRTRVNGAAYHFTAFNAPYDIEEQGIFLRVFLTWKSWRRRKTARKSSTTLTGPLPKPGLMCITSPSSDAYRKASFMITSIASIC